MRLLFWILSEAFFNLSSHFGAVKMLQSSNLIVGSSKKLDLVSTASKLKVTGACEIINNRSSNLRCLPNIYINVF